jgi:predicted ATPase
VACAERDRGDSNDPRAEAATLESRIGGATPGGYAAQRRADCAPLAELLQEQADGNPFFLTEVLKTLAQSRAIAFAPDLGLWRWSLDAVRAGGINANVVDFVVAKLRRLPAETQTALQLAACIGNAFDLRTLSIIDERLPDGVARSLMPALQQTRWCWQNC